MPIGAWEIGSDATPRRLSADRDFLERHLEDWIERDASLLGSDIRWVSRQLWLPDRSRLDLLGLSRDGTWVIVELKRGVISTSTVLQAMHYFLQIAAMPNSDLLDRIMNSSSQLFGPGEVQSELEELRSTIDEEPRDHRLVVAGVGTDGTAEQAAATLGQHGFDVPLQVVSFELLRDSTDRRLLLREVGEDAQAASERPKSTWSLDAVLDLAGEYGVRNAFNALYEALRERGYHSYVKKNGLTFNLGGRKQVFWIKPIPNG